MTIPDPGSKAPILHAISRGLQTTGAVRGRTHSRDGENALDRGSFYESRTLYSALAANSAESASAVGHGQ